MVCDEFHEFVQLAGFNLLFAELVSCKRLCGKAHGALLVSATPHPVFVEEVLDVVEEDQVSILSFNIAPYELAFNEFDEDASPESNPLLSAQASECVVISNTATTAQLGFLRNYAHEQSALFHSKLKKSDTIHKIAS